MCRGHEGLCHAGVSAALDGRGSTTAAVVEVSKHQFTCRRRIGGSFAWHLPGWGYGRVADDASSGALGEAGDRAIDRTRVQQPTRHFGGGSDQSVSGRLSRRRTVRGRWVCLRRRRRMARRANRRPSGQADHRERAGFAVPEGDRGGQGGGCRVPAPRRCRGQELVSDGTWQGDGTGRAPQGVGRAWARRRGDRRARRLRQPDPPGSRQQRGGVRRGIRRRPGRHREADDRAR